MTQPGQPNLLLAALLHERFHEHGWFTKPEWVDETNSQRLDQLRRQHELEAALNDHDADSVPDQNEVA